MKKVRKTVSLLLVLAMVLAAAGCGSTAENKEPAETPNEVKTENTAEEKDAQPESEAAEEAAEENPYEEHVSLHFITRSLYDHNDNNRVIQILEEKFNCDIKWEALPSTDYNSAMSAIIASGDYPDMMEAWLGNYRDEITALYEEGSILGLNELLDTYGQNIKAARPDDLNWLHMEDGEVASIPSRLVNFPERVYMIRQDWLDNLGLEMPTTLDELKEVARAFTFDDPDGNGKDDTVGLAGVTATGLIDQCTFGLAVGAYGETFGWEKTESGDWEPWQIREGTKEAIKWYRECYMEGIVEADFASMTREDYLERKNLNKYGIEHWYTNNMGTNSWWTTFMASVPEANSVVLSPVTQEGYESTIPFVNNVNSGLGPSLLVFSQCEHPERVMAIIDYMASDEGRDLINFGPEGEAWDDVDGVAVQKTLTDQEKIDMGVDAYTLVFWRNTYERSGDPNRIDSLKKYDVVWAPNADFPAYDGDSSALSGLAYSEITKMITEPDIDVDEAFAAFREQYMAMGGREYIDYMTEQYDAVN